MQKLEGKISRKFRILESNSAEIDKILKISSREEIKKLTSVERNEFEGKNREAGKLARGEEIKISNPRKRIGDSFEAWPRDARCN